MKVFSLSFLYKSLFLLVLNVIISMGGPYLLPDSIIQQGVLMTLEGKYTKASDFWDSLEVKYGDLIDVQFFKLLNHHIYMVDFEDYSLYPEFRSNMEKLMILARQESSYRKNFFTGAILFYDSFLLSKQDKWFKSFRQAYKGAGFLEKAVEIDREMAEPYIALGAFKYWKSAKAGVLKIVGLISDERKKGIEYLEFALNHVDGFPKYLARDQFAWILLNEQQPSKALKIARKNLHELPSSRFFKWTVAHCLEGVKQYKEARKLFFELFSSYRNGFNQNNNEYYYNYLYTFYKVLELSASISSAGQKYEIPNLNQYVDEILMNRNKYDERERKILAKIEKYLSFIGGN
ncbi:MAG: hypothetical protein Kow00108_08730 [Calditrichia bacterium]